MKQIREGLRWRLKSMRAHLFLLRSFRNGSTLLHNYRRGLPSDRAICWDGTIIEHPSGRNGFIETLLEIWLDQVYTGTFYQPRDSDVVIDAGANIGLFSLWLARRHPHCRILAFEPFVENFRILNENLARSGATTVETHCAALGAATGTGKMIDGGTRSLDHQLDTQPSEGDPDVINVISLADVVSMSGVDRIALFKMDIEGAENDVLCGSSTDDIRRILRFAIEYHDNIRPRTLERLKNVLEPTHTLRVSSEGGRAYGMLYATSKELIT